MAVKGYGETAEKQIDVAATLRARDYKGLIIMEVME